MIETLENALGKRALRDYQPEQPGDVPQTWADLETVSKGLGYQPKVSFEEGIERFCEWYNAKENQA